MQITDIGLGKNPAIKRSIYRIQDAAADLQIQSSVFDFNSFSETLLQKDNYNLLAGDPRNQFLTQPLKSNTINFSAGVRKYLRSGQTTELTLNHGFNNSNSPFNNFNQNVGAYNGNYLSTVNYSLTQPLLRGRGRNIATISERASYLYIANSEANNEFATSYETLQIGIAYWGYYTAFKSLNIYEQNEARVRKVLSITKELVKADKKPVGDLVQINADLANQERFTITAQQRLYDAKINLGRAIGLSSEETMLLDIPTDEFPVISESVYVSDSDKDNLVQIASERRGDIKAVDKIYEALELQYELAVNNTKPQLDLTGFAFYGSASSGNGIGEGLSSFTNNQGRNVGTGLRLTYTFPLNNNFAKGTMKKQNIALVDQKVINDNLQRNIELNISNAVNGLNNSVLTVKKAEEALNFYEEAFSNEQVKFQTGLTTILNLILFQERLTSSELQYLQAYQQFANSLVNLRHETGTLVIHSDSGFTIDQQAFYSVPKNK
jgi:outer membrane protein TolC